jgi:CNT family concentrative nucleoside transporter
MAIAFVLSEQRRAVRWQVIAAGVVLQLGLGALLLGVPGTQTLFAAVGRGVDAIYRATLEGSRFVFGYLGGGDPPFEMAAEANSFILAFQSLPVLLFMSVLTAIFTYWRVLPWIVRWLGRGLQRGLGIGGALGLGAAGNVFLGMVEAPLLIRPYLANMTRSELFALMTTGMATVAGTVLVVYAQTLADVLPNAAGHMLVASLISLPAAVTIALVMLPESGPVTIGDALPDREASSLMDAIANGTQSGVRLLVQVTAMLLVFVALIALINAALQVLPHVNGGAITLQRMFGWILAPVCWLMGVPWAEAAAAGQLFGIKTVLNEFLAYLELARTGNDQLGQRSTMIMSYAMCGFANFGSLGIMVGGLTAIAPDRRADILALAPRSLISGTLATCCTGCVAGLFFAG